MAIDQHHRLLDCHHTVRTADQAGQPAVCAIVAQVVAQPVLHAVLQPPNVGRIGVQVQQGSLHAPRYKNIKT